MSVLSDATKAIREVLKLTEDVKRTGDVLRQISLELRDHDRRITRMETRWDTTIQLTALRRPADGG